MFTTAYTPNDLKVAQLTLKKGKRLLTSSTISLTGGNIGAKGAKGIKTETKKLSDNVYEITIKGPTGEYCILPIIGGMAIGNGGVFAFTLN